MSIINQMLHKLEQRRGSREPSMPEGVRAVARSADGMKRRSLMLGGFVTAVLVGGIYYGWLWWQQSAKPANSVTVAGKIPGAETQPQLSAAKPVEKIENEQTAIDDAKLEEAAKQLKADQKSVQIKKKDRPTGKPGVPAQEDRADDLVPGLPAAPLSSTGKKPSRESAGKIKIVREPLEQSMKSVTPQQLALSHYQKAMSWLQQGRVAEARNGLEEALKLDPGYLVARQALAGLLVEQREFAQAEQVLQDGLRLNPEQSGFAMALARLQVERGDIRSALDTLYKGLPYGAEKADYQAFLAALLQRTEQHKKAIEHYQAALRLEPSAAWQMGLGISLQAEHRLSDALDAFGRAKASNELAPDLSSFVEQRLRMIKKLLTQQSDKTDQR